MTEPTERDRDMVTAFLGVFLDWTLVQSPNTALSENARNAAELMCAAAREEGRQEERARCAAIAREYEHAAELNTATEQWACAQHIREAIEIPR